ncbi:helix-turn-helix domain-containing protein [Phycisphaera mikurensis]|uniref:Helix-turn-helix domain-containing protein n=1 Tax=Phycisphaera mikurensis (strain NBRC 102666 / KCTC 22515 / FYK2301M01) TaxID=1142394 RepID=I0IHV5_PHYMF|nr:helix-turn-helix domain-containing protein [Phycisphaera mikurensis]MBB6441084.1 hypothetical protein [Phycisphaera mikurensis]BAM04843.1 hypothetical protein PSMK_26840 [Phycisphaera mikurensis NBRC 102666]
MAKMFYTLEEASERLGLDEEAIKALAQEGQLQQFRDRDKLMFKREQIDDMADSSGSSQAIPLSGLQLDDDGADQTRLDSTGLGATGMGNSGLEGTGITLLDDSDDSVIRAADDTNAATSLGADLDAFDSGSSAGRSAMEGTGVSVFDAGEVDDADPMAQTAMTAGIDDEELALESVGSGSGLLDLTRESDDTSLGAELLDEIYPGGSATGESAFAMESSVGSSGVFDGAMGMDTGAGASGPSGLEHLGASGTGSVASSAVFTSPSADDSVAGVHSTPMMASGADEGYDPVGSGMSAGLLFAALLALGIGLAVSASAAMGYRSTLLDVFIGDGGATGRFLLFGGLLILAVVLGVVGTVVGKAAAR